MSAPPPPTWSAGRSGNAATERANPLCSGRMICDSVGTETPTGLASTQSPLSIDRIRCPMRAAPSGSIDAPRRSLSSVTAASGRRAGARPPHHVLVVDERADARGRRRRSSRLRCGVGGLARPLGEDRHGGARPPPPRRRCARPRSAPGRRPASRWPCCARGGMTVTGRGSRRRSHRGRRTTRISASITPARSLAQRCARLSRDRSPAEGHEDALGHRWRICFGGRWMNSARRVA